MQATNPRDRDDLALFWRLAKHAEAFLRAWLHRRC